MSAPVPIVGATGRSLWLWVAGLFAVLALAWLAMFVVASRHPVATVPLEPAPSAP